MSVDAENLDEFLNEYIESISNLPAELSFNMSVIRSLDEEFHSVVESMRHNARSYAAIMKIVRRSAVGLGGGPVIIGADRDARGALTGYRSDYREAVHKAEQKVETSQRVLEQFNAHFNRLEKTLNKLEGGQPQSNNQSQSNSSSYKATRKRPAPAQSTPTPARKSRKKVESPSSSSDEDQLLYCICHQVSYGDMVGCDNPSCPIEWFHYSCVGLVHPPKGKWYCSTCLDAGFGRAILSSGPATPITSLARKNAHKRSHSVASSFTFSSEEDEGEVIDVEETGDEEVDIKSHGGRRPVISARRKR